MFNHSLQELIDFLVHFCEIRMKIFVAIKVFSQHSTFFVFNRYLLLLLFIVHLLILRMPHKCENII